MKFLKKIIGCMMIATGYNLMIASAKVTPIDHPTKNSNEQVSHNSPQFDRLLQQFTQEFTNFARVYKDKNKKLKELHNAADKGVTAALNLKDYIKKHPHEERNLSQTQRNQLQTTILKTLPIPSKAEVKKVLSHMQTLNSLIDETIKECNNIPAQLNDHNKNDYQHKVTKAIKKTTELQNFIKKNPGLPIDSQKRKQVIQAINRLKSIPSYLKNESHKKQSTTQHPQAAKKQHAAHPTTPTAQTSSAHAKVNQPAQQPTTATQTAQPSKPAETTNDRKKKITNAKAKLQQAVASKPITQVVAPAVQVQPVATQPQPAATAPATPAKKR